jgi:predicted RNA-binding protein YlqC (UPF0109 family)
VNEVKELIAFVASSLVDNPDEVRVNVVEADGAVVFELSVAPADLGKVIGKEGRTARAIRTLLASSAAELDGKRAVLEILE